MHYTVQEFLIPIIKKAILRFEDYDIYYLNSNKGIFVIDKICYLGPLLEFLEYDGDLNYEQIKEIRQRLFNGTTSENIQKYVKTY